VLVDLLRDDDAIGVVGFATDATDATGAVAPAGAAPFGSGRIDAISAIEGLSPDGSTSIGDGVALAHSRLDAVSGYPVEATVVLTDGHENEPSYLADVLDLIDERVYAIGMGTPEQLRPAALDTLTNGTGGYLMMTDVLDADDRFRLQKYYLQILGGVRNEDVVVDPEDRIRPGQRHRIPIAVTEADVTCDVVLLVPGRNVLEVELETPDGEVIDAGDAASTPGVSYVSTDRVTYYRLTLPVPTGAGEARAGTWHALVSLDEKGYRRYRDDLEERDPKGFRRVETHGVRYNLSVHARSTLRLRGALSQTSRVPGAELSLRAVLTEYDLPVEGRATVRAAVTRPDGTATTVALEETEPGVFETAFAARGSGTHEVRLLASGHTLRGRPFTREQVLTGAVWHGGDDPLPTAAADPRAREAERCDLLRCLLDDDALGALVAEAGGDPDVLRKCVAAYCRRVTATPEGDERDERDRRERTGRTGRIEGLLDRPGLAEALAEAVRALERRERR
jgi:hypothetical protein